MSNGQRKTVVGVFIVVLLHSFFAQAASFDCKAAKGAVEKIVCSDAALSRLDDDLGNVYTQALMSAPDRAILKREQREWVKSSRNKCTTTRCLSSSYEARIATLKKYVTGFGHSPSPEAIGGVWEELKPAAGGPINLTIKDEDLQFGSCRRIFKYRGMFKDEYIYAAVKRGKCEEFSDRFELNIMNVSITDSERIHVEFYAGAGRKNFVGSNNFYKLQ